MPFNDQPPVNLNVKLVDIDNEVAPAVMNEDGTVKTPAVPKDPAVAIFEDKSQLKFPKGVKFTVDNHTEPESDRVVQMRMRASVWVDGQAKPVVSVLIPIFCSKQYVMDCIKRLEQRV